MSGSTPFGTPQGPPASDSAWQGRWSYLNQYPQLVPQKSWTNQERQEADKKFTTSRFCPPPVNVSIAEIAKRKYARTSVVNAVGKDAENFSTSCCNESKGETDDNEETVQCSSPESDVTVTPGDYKPTVILVHWQRRFRHPSKRVITNQKLHRRPEDGNEWRRQYVDCTSKLCYICQPYFGQNECPASVWAWFGGEKPESLLTEKEKAEQVGTRPHANEDAKQMPTEEN